MSKTKGTELHEEKERPERVTLCTMAHWSRIYCEHGLYEVEQEVMLMCGYRNIYIKCRNKQMELDVLAALLTRDYWQIEQLDILLCNNVVVV